MHPLEKALPQDSWFRRWLQVWPLSEAPKSFILCGALAMMGAAIGRRVWFEDDQRKLWVMLNLLHIGPSGIGKSESLDTMGFRLLHALPPKEQPQIVADAVTPEKLHLDLRARPKTLLFSSELSSMFTKQRYMEAMVPYVTRLLDYPAVLERRTKSDDVIIVKRPSVTVVGASTTDWLQDQMPDTAVSGGFLARFFIMHEQHKGQSVPLAGRSKGQRYMSELHSRRARVIDEFKDMITQIIPGEINFKDYSAIDAFTLWYSAFKPDSGYLAPFAARAREFVLRISILFAVSSGRSSMGRADIEAAIALFSYSMGRLQEVVVPLTVKGKMLNMVLKILSQGTMSAPAIKRAMRNQALSSEVETFLNSLIASNDVVRLSDGRYRRRN